MMCESPFYPNNFRDKSNCTAVSAVLQRAQSRHGSSAAKYTKTSKYCT